MLWSVSERNTWSASVVCKDGTEENAIVLFLDSLRGNARGEEKKSFKIFYICVWGIWLTAILLETLCALLERRLQGIVVEVDLRSSGMLRSVDSCRRFGTD